MKAIQVSEFGGPEVLKQVELLDLHPGPKQVVVQIKAAGVNPVDTYIRTGTHAYRPPLPYVPGFDGAGIIKELGQGVKNFKIGQRVYLSGSLTGAYAEQALCDETQIHPLGDNLSFSQGAGVHVPFSTAYRALFVRAQAKPGETVLIHGASGGVGTAAVQLARAYGLRVIGTAGTEKGLKLVQDQGAHFVIDHHQSDYLDQIKEWAGGGMNIILEMLANVNLGNDLTILNTGARVVVIGSRGTVEIDPRLLMSNDASILGMSIMFASKQELVGIHAALQAGLENGSLRPIVGQEIALAEAPKAHKAVLEAGAHGKIVLIP